jgi:hypothetical protein
MESTVEFTAVDCPQANRLTIHILAAVAEHEAASRAHDLLPVIRSAQTSGATSLRQIADVLNDRGIKTARGGDWSAVQVQRVLQQAS